MRAMAGVDQRLGHDPDRVGEVDDPGLGCRVPAGQLRELEHDRHGAQRLGKSAGAGRLLADGAEPEGERLVQEARRLAADPQLDQDEVAPSIGGRRRRR